LSVEMSDISEEESDVIVNTTSQEMQLGSSAVSKALLAKAGPILQQTCSQLVQSGLSLDHGQVVETKSFGSLKCKKILHAHIPARADAVKVGTDHSSFIASTVAKCLKEAEAQGMTSISFPAFGFGQGGYDVSEVAGPMLTAFKDFGSEGPKQIQVIRVVIYDQKLHKQFFDFFVKFFKVDLSAPQKFVTSIKSKLDPKGGHGGKYVELQTSTSASLLPAPAPFEPVKNQLLLFDIYAPSVDDCSNIALKLKDYVKSQCLDDEIERPVIANLIDSDIAEIKQIGTDSRVQIDVIPQIKKIKISGERGDTKEAKMKIFQIISEIEKAQAELKMFQWQTESGDDLEPEPYSEDDSFKLERARAKKVQALQLVVDHIEVVVDLGKMEERCKESGTVRKVIRVPIEQPCEF
jgi:poly [ADP-ribose] polymerase 10/14/15